MIFCLDGPLQRAMRRGTRRYFAAWQGLATEAGGGGEINEPKLARSAAPTNAVHR